MKSASESSALAGKSANTSNIFLVLTIVNVPLNRLEKKEADRLKLTAEFPLLFNNKTVGNKVLSSSMNLNSKTLLSPVGKTPITPAGKRRSVAADKNDENCAFSANKSATKLSLGAKTPLSSKKQRKGSMIGSKIPVSSQLPPAKSAASAIATPSTIAPTEPIAEEAVVVAEVVEAVTPEPAAEVVEQPMVVELVTPMEVAPMEVAAIEQAQLADSPVQIESVQSQAETVPQSALEPSAVVRGRLFEDEELEQFTSTRSSLSSLGESIAGDIFASKSSEEGSNGNSTVQEQVLDVLDYLLELDEVDEVTYRRMSSQAFSVKTLKRLSMNMATTQPNREYPAEPVVTGEESAEQQLEDEQEGEAQTRRSSDVPMDVAYPESQEDCVIGELDVLNALRNYLAVVTREPETSKAVPAPVDAPISEFHGEETAEITATSARSSGNSVTTFDPRPQWASAGDSVSGSQRSSVSGSASARSSLDSCCTTTMRVSFASAGTISASTSMKRKSVEAPAEVETAAPVAVAPPAKKSVVTHPMADLLNDALMRGLVVPSIIDRMEMGNHTKYIVQTQVIKTAIRMLFLSDHFLFSFFTDPVGAGLPRGEQSRSHDGAEAVLGLQKSPCRVDRAHGRQAQSRRTHRRRQHSWYDSPSYLATDHPLCLPLPHFCLAGKRSSLDGDDILSLARSRRSSVESCYRESLLNPRDSLCADFSTGAGGFQRSGRESELLPPLPSRQIMSMT